MVVHIILSAGAEAVNGWTKAEVISEAVAGIGIVATLFFTLWSWAKSVRAGYYAELDRMYFDLLQMAVERPYLLDADAITDPMHKREYELYAFMVWNFLETVYDRCGRNKQLTETWYPVVAAENQQHRKWFDVAANRTRFKKRFIDFIEKGYPVASKKC
jgi:hypothetical protein